MTPLSTLFTAAPPCSPPPGGGRALAPDRPRRSFRLSWLAAFALMLSSVSPALADSGIFNGFVIINSGFGNNYYDLNGTTQNTQTGNFDFNGTNLGTFGAASTLNLSGGEIQTYKNSGCNVTGTTLWYRLYPTASGPGATTFTGINVLYNSNISGCCGNEDQKWITSGNTANLLSGLSSGNYTLEVYEEASSTCSVPTNFWSDGGSNYKATFSYNSLCGTNYTIDNSIAASATNFTTFASAFAALNNFGVTCATTFTVKDGTTYTESGLQLNTITGASSTNKVTFVRSGGGTAPIIQPAATSPGVAVSDEAIIRLVGTDFVTFDGLTLRDNTGSNAAGKVEYGFAFRLASTTNGSQDNVIKNCSITLDRSNSLSGATLYGIALEQKGSTGSSLTAASTAGAQSRNVFTSNTISFLTTTIPASAIGFLLEGTTGANMDANNEVGQTSLGNGITNWGGTTSNMAGVNVNNQNNLKIVANTITSNATGNTSTFQGINVRSGCLGTVDVTGNNVTVTSTASGSQLTGIRQQSAATTVNINGNTVTGTYGSGSGAFFAIANEGGCGTLNVGTATVGTGNTVQNISHTTTGTLALIYLTATPTTALSIQSNTLQNNTRTSASGTTYGIYTVSTSVGGAVTISGNTISGNSVTNGSSVTYMIFNQASATGGLTISGNTVQTTTLSSTAIFYAINNSASSATNAVTISGNQILNNTALNTTSSAYGIYNNHTSTANSVTGNTVKNFNKTGSGGTLYGYYSPANSVTGNTDNISNNKFWSLTGAGSTTVYGINVANGSSSSSGPTITVQSNSVKFLTSTSGSVTGIATDYSGGTLSTIASDSVVNLTTTGTIIGIQGGQTNTATPLSVTQNTVYNLSGNSASVIGIQAGGISGSTITVSRNKVASLSSTNTNPVVAGLATNGSGNTVTFANNLVGNLTASAANAANAVVGMNLSSGTTLNAYFNTIYLNATSSGGLFGTSGISASTTPTLDLRNNVVVNLSTPNGAGLTVAYRRSSATLTSFAATSNNNLYYAGTPGASRLIFTDGATPQQNLPGYKTAVGPTREAQAVTENPPFLSTTSTATNFLHVDPAVGTQIESGGVAVSGITVDYDGQTRNVSTPDIGADEGTFTVLDLTAPVITITTPLANTASLTGPTLTGVTVTDASGVNVTAGTKPRAYYKLSTDPNAYNGNTSATVGWKYVEASNASSPFSFTFDYSLLPSAPVAGTIIQYFVVAQDLASTPNVGISTPNTFAATPATVALTSAAFPIGGTLNSYTILTTFSGTVNVGPGQPYTSLTAAGGLFAAINAGVLTGNLTALITGDIAIEDGINQLKPPTEDPAASNFTIRIAPSATTERLITGAGSSIGSNGIMLNGADRVTIDGRFNQTGTTKYLRFRSTSTTVPVFSLIQDATNNEIRDCYIESGNTSSTAAAVLFGTSAGTVNGVVGGSTGNDLNKVTNCDIFPVSGSSLAQGFYSGSTVAASNSSCEVTGNNIYNWTTTGVLLNNGNGGSWKINANSFYQTVSSSSTTQRAIDISSIAAATSFEVKDNFIGGSGPLATGTWTNTNASPTFRCIYLNGLATSVTTPGNAIVQGNTIQNITLTGTGASVFNAIEVTNSATFYAVGANTIQDINSASTTSGNTSPALAGILTASTAFNVAGNAQVILGNTIQRLNLTNTATTGWVEGVLTKTSPVQTGAISFNRIANLTSAATSTSSGLIGIHLWDGTWTLTNNQIALTNGASTVGLNVQGIRDDTRTTVSDYFYFNSVRIGGSAATGAVKTYAYVRLTSATTDLRNNVLLNERVNAGATGKHFSVGLDANTSFTSNYNDVYAAVSAQTAEVGTTAYHFTGWQTAPLSKDANGKNVNVKFVNATIGNLNLDPTTNCQLDGTGETIAGVNGEFDNVLTSRQFTLPARPDIGSDEFSYTQQTASFNPAGPLCGTTTATITFTGGNGPYSVTYTDGVTPVTLTNQSSPTSSFAVTQGKTYTINSVTTMDAYGCTLSPTGTLTINVPATADAGPATGATCGQTAYALAGSVGGGATGGTWSTAGDGSFSPNATTLNASYTPGPTDASNGTVTLTLTSSGQAAPCTAATDNLVLTINPPATADAGPATGSTCGQTAYALTGSVGGGATGGTWSTSGDGSFSPNATTLNATYTPGTTDASNGTVTLTLTSSGQLAPCGPATDNLVLTINPPATANAGPATDVTCGQTPVALTGSLGGGATGGTWSTSGDGSFSPNATTLNATYTPGTTDASNGTVTLTLTSSGQLAPCGPATDNLVLTINPPATANAGPATGSTCASSPFSLSGTIGGGATGGTWSTSGDGSFSPNATTLSASYTPGPNDLTNGTATLTLTSSGQLSPCGPATDNLVLTINTTTTWTGTVDTNWYTTGNWTTCVPTAEISAIIPNVANDPVISLGTAVVKDLTIQASGALMVSGASTVLDIRGTFTNAGTYSASAGTTRFNGNSALSIPQGTYFDIELMGTTLKQLTGNVDVAHNLTLSTGSVQLGSNNLHFTGTTGAVVGASSAAFVVTNSTGNVGFVNVGPATPRGATVVFPIGSSAAATDYTPATLANNGTATVADDFFGRVSTGISRIVMGTPTAITTDVVNKTWDIEEGTPGGTRAGLTLQWNSANETPGFNNMMCAISHQVAGAWQAGDFAPAAGTNPWTRYQGGITSFSPFGVEDLDRPLPVELTAFSAVRRQQDAVLTWTTASEKNSRGFEVQVATRADGEYRALGFVASPTPTSQTPRTYTFTDQQAGKVGVRYYRLRQLDVDGTEHLSTVRTVLFDGQVTMGVTAVPNPFSAGTGLKIDVAAAADGEAVLTLMDDLGRVMMRQQVQVVMGNNSVQPILPDALAAGSYTLITQVGGESFRTRLVKQ